MNETQLQALVNEGKSIQELSVFFNKSKTSIRHWLTKYNLKTTGKAGNKAVEIINNQKNCGRCNRILDICCFGTRTDRKGKPRTYCMSCETDSTLTNEHKLKDTAIAYLGGKCEVCDVIGDRRIYDFHHTRPEHKDFNISSAKSLTFNKIINELDKCVLVCANCHQEIHIEIAKKNNATVKENTERWNNNKLRKILAIGKPKCSVCNYSTCIGALVIKFKQEDAHLRKYNKTHWNDTFKTALSHAKVICKNCNRKYTLENYKL